MQQFHRSVAPDSGSCTDIVLSLGFNYSCRLLLSFEGRLASLPRFAVDGYTYLKWSARANSLSVLRMLEQGLFHKQTFPKAWSRLGAKGLSNLSS